MQKDSMTIEHLMILKRLREDARKSLAEISRETGIANSTVFDYYRHLRKSAIKKHTSILDFARLGYPLRKKFFIRGKDKEKLFSFLKSSSCVNNIYRIDGSQAICEAFFRSVADVESFKQELKLVGNAKDVKEYDVLEELKYESFIPQMDDRILSS